MTVPQNINHVDHVIWVCRIENQPSYVNQLEKLCQVKFEGPFEKEELGTRVYICWTAGLEIIAPLPGDSPWSVSVRDHLEKRGEGLMGMVFGVPDIDAARDHAVGLGYKVSGLIEKPKDSSGSPNIEDLKEIVVGDFMNSLFVFGEITYPDGVFITSKEER